MQMKKGEYIFRRKKLRKMKEGEYDLRRRKRLMKKIDGEYTFKREKKYKTDANEKG